MTSTLPPLQRGPAVWRGDELASRVDEWTWMLTDTEIDELRTAAAPFAAGSTDVDVTAVAAVRLGALGDALARLRVRLVRGRGFELIRGLPVAEMTPGEVAAAFAIIGHHIGSPRSQNAAGDLLGHVRDLGLDPAQAETRIYQTSARQTFHTDSTDVVGLACLRPAASGGESLLVSAGHVYNTMLSTEPDLAVALFEPVATDRRGEVPAGMQPWFEIPVLTWFDGHLTVMYQRQYIDSAARFADAPRLTDRQRRALDRFDEIANTSGVALRMDLEPGDVQFVHNHALLHDRTAFTDDPRSPRHLLRLWLSVPGDRRLPPVFAQRYGSTVIGDRGGIVVGGAGLGSPAT